MKHIPICIYPLFLQKNREFRTALQKNYKRQDRNQIPDFEHNFHHILAIVAKKIPTIKWVFFASPLAPLHKIFMERGGCSSRRGEGVLLLNQNSRDILRAVAVYIPCSRQGCARKIYDLKAISLDRKRRADFDCAHFI